jgi:hypothetical protein
MSWQLDEEEIRSVLSFDVDARYAYAINKFRTHGELWTLKDEEGWVLSRNPRGVSSVPVWPHERFAKLEATGAWANARPDRIALDADWLTDSRARWFDENEVRVTVFLVGPSSMSVGYTELNALFEGVPRSRYLRGRQSSGVARKPKRDTRETKDLVTYVSDLDIAIVLARVPDEYRTRVRDVLRRRSSDAKTLGSVTTFGRRDIELSTRLPIRVSLGRYLHGGQSPEEFGAPKLGQWPPWAVRRFVLYDVLFHEVGHLQVIDKSASRVKRKFASETRAQEFADELRRTLYSEPFEHPDPVHNTPTIEELSMFEVWNRLDKTVRGQLVNLVLAQRSIDNAARSLFEPMTVEQRRFFHRVVGG